MNRDLGSTISAAGFSRVEMEEFRMPRVPRLESPSIIGVAWK
jgi:hypothetical protein